MHFQITYRSHYTFDLSLTGATVKKTPSGKPGGGVLAGKSVEDLLRTLHFWIQRIAQAVAKESEGQHDQRNADGGRQ